MTVAQLISLLKTMPSGAQVEYPNMEIDDECGIHRAFYWRRDNKVVFDKKERD